MIGSAIILGICLSLILIGPVFFLLIETSLTKGVRAAISLEAGVILADLTCVAVAFYSSQDLLRYIEGHPFLYKIAGFIIVVYGLHTIIISRTNIHIKGNGIVSNNYFKTFINGYLLNFVNIGVIIFWITTTILINGRYPNAKDFFLYISIVFLTMIAIDMAKIFLANTFKHKLTDQVVIKIRKTIGFILIIFGIIIFIKSYHPVLRKGNSIIPNGIGHNKIYNNSDS